MSSDRRTVELPGEVVDRLAQRVPHTEFDDVDAYVTHVLEEVLYNVDQNQNLGDAEPVDKQQVRERLESLGYLNE